MAKAELNATLVALADRNRRAVIDILKEQPRRAGEIASALSMTPPALSRHLRVLRRSGLIDEQGVEADARVRIYRLRKEPFDQLAGGWGKWNRSGPASWPRFGNMWSVRRAGAGVRLSDDAACFGCRDRERDRLGRPGDGIRDFYGGDGPVVANRPEVSHQGQGAGEIVVRAVAGRPEYGRILVGVRTADVHKGGDYGLAASGAIPI